MRACPAPARQAPTAAAADRAGPPINPSCIGMLKIGECHSAMRIDVVDPSAYAPHYDHGLCRALARAGAEVRLVTSDFRYGPVPQADGYEVERVFYRRAANSRRRRLRRVAKLAQHPADMARYQRLARAADVVHFQWFAVEPLDVALRPRGRPTVMTAHLVMPIRRSPPSSNAPTWSRCPTARWSPPASLPPPWRSASRSSAHPSAPSPTSAGWA